MINKIIGESMKKGVFILVIVATFATSIFAKADIELVREYMDISGATQTISSLSTQITSGIKQTSAMYGKKPSKKRLELIKTLFAPNRSIKVVEDKMAMLFNDDELLEIINFYHSKVGKEIVDAELNSISPETQSDMLHYIADLRENPPSKKRAKLISKFIDVVDMSGVIKDLFFEMFDYLNREAPKSKRASMKQRSQFMERLNSSFDKQLYLSTLYMYRDISDNDLESAIQYFQSKSGIVEKKVNRTAIREMVKMGFKRVSRR